MRDLSQLRRGVEKARDSRGLRNLGCRGWSSRQPFSPTTPLRNLGYMGWSEFEGGRRQPFWRGAATAILGREAGLSRKISLMILPILIHWRDVLPILIHRRDEFRYSNPLTYLLATFPNLSITITLWFFTDKRQKSPYKEGAKVSRYLHNMLRERSRKTLLQVFLLCAFYYLNLNASLFFEPFTARVKSLWVLPFCVDWFSKLFENF